MAAVVSVYVTEFHEHLHTVRVHRPAESLMYLTYTHTEHVQ